LCVQMHQDAAHNEVPDRLLLVLLLLVLLL
jgi:hypothetical protein